MRECHRLLVAAWPSLTFCLTLGVMLGWGITGVALLLIGLCRKGAASSGLSRLEHGVREGREEGSCDRSVLGRLVSFMSEESGSTIREKILDTAVRSGPWAVLSGALLFGIGYEVHTVIIPSVARYVEASASSITKLEESVVHNSDAITRMSSAIIDTNSSIRENNSKIMLIQETLIAANKMMSEVPSIRREELELLRKIAEHIEKEEVQ